MVLSVPLMTRNSGLLTLKNRMKMLEIKVWRRMFISKGGINMRKKNYIVSKTKAIPVTGYEGL
jgi:hypothetical protein